MVDEALVPVLLLKLVARSERIRAREDALARATAHAGVDVLHEDALPATLLGREVGERVAGAQRLLHVVGLGHHHAVPDAVVAGKPRDEQAFLVAADRLTHGRRGFLGRIRPGEDILEEAVRAAVVEDRRAEVERVEVGAEVLGRLAPDGVGEIVVVDREVDALLPLQTLEDGERGAWPVVGRHADEKPAHAHRVSGLAVEPAVVVDLVQVELLRLFEISVQRLLGTAAVIAPAGRYEERADEQRGGGEHPDCSQGERQPARSFVRKTHGSAG